MKLSTTALRHLVNTMESQCVSQRADVTRAAEAAYTPETDRRYRAEKRILKDMEAELASYRTRLIAEAERMAA